MSLIEVRDLSYKYSEGLPDEKTAVDSLSLSFERGEFVGIIGATGSGKSTFIQTLNGLLKPTSGEVLLDGVNIWTNKETLRECRFKVGLVFQYPEYQLFEESVYKDVAYGPSNMGLGEAEIDARVKRACEFVGLGAELFSRSPFELSGGQKRRVAIAGVLAMDPEVLILDEPTAGLDPSGCEEILSEIAAYHRQRGGTVLLVSHSMDDVARLADRVLVLEEGKLFGFDTMKNIFKRAEELEKLGLSIPAATSIMLELKRLGYEVDTSVYTAADAAEEIARALEREGKANA
ncbi:MAG: energy-coupling factor transporter ATPase [Oscillospiraceae bacterium]|nr:energy-coupling factor transporter ATPase [Oscillospiraceae bacterium]